MTEFSPGSADDANFRAIIERTAVAIFVCVDGIIAFANQAAVRLLGIDEGQTIVGLSMRDFFHKDYAVAMSFGLEGLGSEKDPLPLPMIRRDGRVIDVEVIAAPLAGRLIIEARDVSHARRVEDALRYARDQLEERIEERTRDYARLLRQHEQILNSAAEGIVGLDAEGKITFVNPSAVRMTGWNAWELIGLSAGEKLLRAPDATEPEGEAFAMPGVNASIRTVERTLWRRDGGSFSVEFALAPIEEEGRPVGGVMILRDVAERKRTEEKLRLVAAVFETTAEAIIVLDSSFVISTVNPAYCMITGYTLDEVQGTRPGFLGEEAGQTDLLRTIGDAVRANGRWDREQWNRRKNGEEYAERISVTGITDDVGRIAQYVVVFSDITQRKVDEERIRYQANYDALTSLPNRTLFMDRLGHAVVMAERTGQRVGLMFLDLDGFKLVNDTFGHDVGDELLKEAGKRLLFCVRNGDTVARLGGDEFTIIMPNLGEIRNAPMVAQRIIESLEMPFVLKGQEAFVSASIGITTFPDDAANVNDLLKYADAAMYRAKDQGKANFQFFTAELNAAAHERSLIKTGLSKALERNEFILFYQPKCDLATGRLTGVEALLRWKNPELGLVSPVKFSQSWKKQA